MKYISTDDSEKYDIKHGQLTESPVRGSTTRFICNPIVDDAEAGPNPEEEYQPPSCPIAGEPSVNDLAAHRWHNGGLDAGTEAQLIQRIKDGVSTRLPKSNPGRDDERAFRQLLEAFHRTVVEPAGKFIPGGAFYRRQPKKQKHTNDLLYEDLTSVGCFALWQSVVRFDPDRGHRFSTLSRHKIIGAISNEANYLRQRGYTSGDTVGRYLWKEVGRRTQSRLDRRTFSNLGAPPENLLEAQEILVKRPIYRSLEEAADALKRANNLQHPELYSDSGDDDKDRDSYDTSKTNTATESLEEFRDVYDTQNPLYLSPQLVPHRNKVSPIVDFWMRELCDPPRLKAKQRLYKPCAVKPTGRVRHPIETPYWMEPHDERPKEKASKPYDPYRREVATVRLKNGKTKRQYRQVAAGPCRHIAMMEQKGTGKLNVRAEPNKANGSPIAEIVILESRRSGKSRLHVSERHMSSCVGERFTC